MGAVLILAALAVLAGVVVSRAHQWWAWRGLDEGARVEQTAIKEADLRLFAAQSAHKKGVGRAGRDLQRAAASPRRAQYGSLRLHEEHVDVGGSTYPLTPKTKARVHGHGRGEQRVVMVLLEDVSWTRSLSAKKVGKSNELSAQQFVAEARVLAAQADQTRAARAHATGVAQQALASARGDTADIDQAQAARDALGKRHRGSGPAPGRRWRRAALPAALVALIAGAALTPTESGTTTDQLATRASASPTASPTPAPDRAALRAQGRRSVSAGDYAGAVATVSELGRADVIYVQRLASNRAARIAARALSRADRSTAHRALVSVEGFAQTTALTSAQRRYAAANAAVSRARSRRKAQAAERKAQAKAQRRAEALAARQQAERSAQSDTSSDYAGMTCPEIGHSFSVPPGSDPDHDADNDGVACESQ